MHRTFRASPSRGGREVRYLIDRWRAAAFMAPRSFADLSEVPISVHPHGMESYSRRLEILRDEHRRRSDASQHDGASDFAAILTARFHARSRLVWSIPWQKRITVDRTAVWAVSRKSRALRHASHWISLADRRARGPATTKRAPNLCRSLLSLPTAASGSQCWRSRPILNSGISAVEPTS